MIANTEAKASSIETCVLGAGAVGGYVAGMVAREHPVAVLCRPDQKARLISDGLKIRGPLGEFRVSADDLDTHGAVKSGLAVTDSPERAVRGSELIFLCVKSQDTESVVSKIAPHVSPTATLILLQNGVRNKEVVDRILGPGRCLETVVLFNSLYVNPGEVVLTATESVIFDESEKEKPAAKKASGLLEGSGIATRFHRNVHGILWTKLIINLNNGSSALTGRTLFQGLRDPATRAVSSALMREGMEILSAAGVSMEPIPKVDPPKVLWLLKMPGWLACLIMKLLIKPYEDVQSSTWQSRVRGKPTEIDYLNGEIVRLAESIGRDAPLNRKIVQLVREFEEKGSGRETLPSAELKRMLGL